MNFDSPKKDKNFYKQLKAPDAFQVKALRAIKSLENHKKALVVVAGGIALVILGFFGFGQWKNFERNKLRNELGTAEKEYRAELTVADTKIKAIQDKATSLTKEKEALEKDSEKNKDAIEKKSQEIKDLQSQVEKIKPDHSKSKDLYAKFYNKYPTKPEGFWAGMRYATFLMENKKPEEAKTILQAIVGNAKDYPIYEIQGRLALLAALEDLKSYDEAIALTDDLIKIVPKDIKPRILLAKGRMLIEQKKNPEATAALENLIKDHSSSHEADVARAYKAMIN